MKKKLVCKGWMRAALAGKTKVATGSGRLIFISASKGPILIKSCPFCGALFYTIVAGQSIFTLTGAAHRAVTRAASK